MNVQPPIHDKLVVLPFGLQRAVTDGTARKPSLAIGGPPHPIRSHVVAFIGEFLGTFMFLFFALMGASVALIRSDPTLPPSLSTLLYISLAFGFSFAVNAWIFFRISGGLFNPAVTLGLMLIGCLTYFRASVVFVAQMLGALLAAGVVRGLTWAPPAETLLSDDTSIVRGFFIEMFLTALLVFAIFMLAAEKHRATFIAPIGIGLALFIGHLAGAAFTGAGINPARAFSTAVVGLHFPGYHWIYWIGPLVGSLLAVLVYRIIKALEYETYGATGQDADHVATTVPVVSAV